MSILQTKEIFVKKLFLLAPEDSLRLDFGKATSYFKVEKINYKNVTVKIILENARASAFARKYA